MNEKAIHDVQMIFDINKPATYQQIQKMIDVLEKAYDKIELQENAINSMLAAFEYDGQTEGENQACSLAKKALIK